MNLLKFDPSKRISAKQALNHPYFEEIRSMQMDSHLRQYQKYTAKIIDLAIDENHSQQKCGEREKGNNNNKGNDVNHYRRLIEQLEKYAERSTNRSSDFMKYVNFNNLDENNNNMERNVSLEHNFPQKSEN